MSESETTLKIVLFIRFCMADKLNGQGLPVRHTKPYKNWNFQNDGAFNLRYFGVLACSFQWYVLCLCLAKLDQTLVQHLFRDKGLLPSDCMQSVITQWNARFYQQKLRCHSLSAALNLFIAMFLCLNKKWQKHELCSTPRSHLALSYLDRQPCHQISCRMPQSARHRNNIQLALRSTWNWKQRKAALFLGNPVFLRDSLTFFIVMYK